MAKQTIDENVDTVEVALLSRLQPNDDELFAEPSLGISAAEATYLQALKARITAANLVDRTAAETISGQWTFSTRPQIDGVDCIVDGDYANAPSGAIAFWSGLIANIPSGWVICNGANDTSDVMGKYIMGAPAGLEAGQIGGAHSINVSEAQMPQHLHTGTSSAVAAHTHSYNKPSTGSNKYQTVGSNREVEYENDDTWSGGAHTHAGTSGGTGGGQAIDNRPASRKLIVIMKL